MLRVFRNSLLFISMVGLGVTSAYAQRGLDVFVGAGTASDSSTGQSIDTYSTGTLYGTPKLAGAFARIGADFMLTKHFGVNGETDFRLSQGDYAGLTYRPTLYDFNGIWLPARSRARIQPELQAGLGGMNMKYYYSTQYCDSFVGCSTTNNYLESSNHLQVHLSAGVRFYVTPHIFVRPQIDAHYVSNLNQFGSNWIPEYGTSVGYTFGER